MPGGEVLVLLNFQFGGGSGGSVVAVAVVVPVVT